MRDTSKTKNLEREKGRLEKKVEDQARELKELKERLGQTRRGAVQLQAAVDALLTAVVLEFGAETEAGGKGLELPGFSAAELNEAYALQARRGAEGKGYVLTAHPRKENAEEDGGGTGGEKDRNSEG